VADTIGMAVAFAIGTSSVASVGAGGAVGLVDPDGSKLISAPTKKLQK